MKNSLFAFATSLDAFIILVGTIGAIGMGVIQPFLYVLTGSILGEMDEFTTKDEFYEATIDVVSIMAILGLAFTVLGYISVLCWVNVGARQGYHFRKAYFSKVLSMSCDWYDSNSIQEIPYSLTNDSLKIEQATGEKCVLFIFTISMIITAVILSLYSNVQLALVALCFGPICTAGILLTNRGIKAECSYNDSHGVPEETLQEIKTVSAFNAQREEAKRYVSSLSQSYDLLIQNGMKIGIGVGLASSGFLFMMAAVFTIGGIFVDHEEENWIRRNTIGVTEIIIIQNVGAFAFNNIASLLPSFRAIKDGKRSASKIIDILNTPSEEHQELRKKIEGNIEFKNVAFSYIPEDPVLKNVSFYIPSGSSYAIVGSTGSGKSSIVSLILRFYSNSSGQILLDNIPIENLNIKHLRKSIGLVSQEPLLFNTSILENIRLGNLQASLYQVNEAARKACALDFINKMPDGLETQVGQKGSFLSGGQKQRVAIARAVLRESKIVILDEATSALDKKTEKIVTNSLEEAWEGVTRIRIAQNLSSIRGYDKIGFLKEGEICEEGTHIELLNLGGEYAQLVQMQKLNDMRGNFEEDEAVEEFDKEIEKADTKEKNSEYTKRILQMSKKKWVFIAIFGTIVVGSSYPMIGLFFGRQVHALVMKEDDLIQASYTNGFFIVMIAALVMIGTLLQSLSYPRLSAEVTNKLREDTFRKLMSYDAAYFDKNNSSVLCSKLAQDCENLNSIGVSLIGLFIGAIMCFAIGNGVSAAFSWKISSGVFCVVPLYMVSKLTTILAQVKGLIKQSYEKSGILASDIILNYKSIKALNLQKYLLKQYTDACELDKGNTSLKAHTSGISYSFGFGILFLIVAYLFWYCSYLYKEEQVGFKNMLISMYMAVIGVDTILILSVYASDIGSGYIAAKRIFSIHKYEPSIEINDKSGLISNVQGQIQFSKVSFVYPSRDVPALKNVDIFIPPLSSVAIVGSSGSGKSTIVQLLLRFYDVSRGSILIDDTPITKYNLKYLRKNIGLVSQEPVLFSGSVLRNIKYGMKCNLEEIEKAAEDARIDFEITREVGFKGTKLSGGQKQRVAIARALIRKPKIIILDEATSALDNATENAVLGRINELKATTIIISHRQSIETDQTVHIESGRIIN